MLQLSALGILTFLAIIPVFIMFIYIYLSDKIEKEPIWLLFIIFVAGGLSVISALILEIIGGFVLDIGFEVLGMILPLDYSVPYAFLECFFVVAIAEEMGKFVGMFIPTWKSKNFDYRFDGIVYGVTVSLGFALIENIMYVVTDPAISTLKGAIGTMVQADVWSAIGDGFVVGIMRALTSIPAHTMFGVFMGLFYGFAKYYAVNRRKGIAFGFIVLSWIVPIVLHGIYDFLLSVDSVIAMLLFFVFIIGMYVFTFILTIVASKTDRKLFVPIVPPVNNIY